MLKKKVLIISTSRAEQLMLEKIRQHEFHFETTSSFGQSDAWWEENSPDALIICLPEDKGLQGHFIKKMRADLSPLLGILVLTTDVNHMVIRLSQMFQKIRTLKAPAEGPAVMKMLTEITTDWGPEKKQIHPRYTTDQEATLAVAGDMKFWPVRVRNISIGGALVEIQDEKLPAEFDFKVRDSVTITFHVGAPQKIYQFPAKVAWVKKENAVSQIGVEYVTEDADIQRLLKKE